MTEVVQELFVT